MGQPGIFYQDQRYRSLSNSSNPLGVLTGKISWERFWPLLKKALKKPRKSNAGRKALAVRKVTEKGL
ncbi:MAG: hypothetical protein ACYC6B_02855 [Thermoleophilia bacterium]